MATISRPSMAFQGGPDPGFQIVRIGPEGQRAALARLLGVPQSDKGIDRFLANAGSEPPEKPLIWAALDALGRPMEVVLVTPSSGRTAMAFVSNPESGGSGIAAAAAAIRAACAFLADPGAGRDLRLVQSLVEPDQPGLIQALAGAGFTRLADLAYLRRPLALRGRDEHPAWPEGVDVVEVSRLPRDRSRALMAEALERSYEGTLDCAALCGLRDVQDVLDSHLGVGEHDPSLWFVVMHGGRAAGAMFLSPCPEQGTVELVYLGLATCLRGRGLARSLLNMGLSRLGGRPERTVACAVDMINTPALRLYRDARFKQFAVRVAMIRPIPAANPS